MNKVYRIVRSKIDGRLIVASEIARGAVKGKGASMLTMTALLLLNAAHAADPNLIVPATTGAAIPAVQTSNGRSWVDIKAPDANGISHNQYTKFNVNSNTAAIINNATSNLATTANQSTTGATRVVQSWSSANTQVAIPANVNFGSATTGASVILNEVLITGGTASSLAGVVEIAGHKANLIIANPYGITVNGASFINASDVVLATGSVNSITGSNVNFQLTDHSLTVSDNTVSGSATQATTLTAAGLALISRQVSIAGKIEADKLRVVAHNGQAILDTSTTIGTITTNTTGALTSAAPSWAIDSTVLGGMYANTISLIATEAGAGVRTVGNMAALGDAITIQANGDLVVGNASASAPTQLQANRVTLQSTAATGDVTLANATLSAITRPVVVNSVPVTVGGTIAVTAGGDLVLDKATVSAASGTDPANANGNITLDATTLADNAATGRASVVNAGGQLRVNTTGATTVSASNLVGKTVDIDAASLTLGTTGLIGSSNEITSATDVVNIATSGNIAISGELNLGSGTSSVTSSAGSVTLDGTSKVAAQNVSVQAGTSNQVQAGAQVATSGNLSLLGATVSSQAPLSVRGNLRVGSSNSTVNLGASGADTLLSVGGNLLVEGAVINVFSDASVTGTVNLGNGSNTSVITVDAQSALVSNGAFSMSGGALSLNGDVLAKSGGINDSSDLGHHFA